jgi:hypothetical protein
VLINQNQNTRFSEWLSLPSYSPLKGLVFWVQTPTILSTRQESAALQLPARGFDLRNDFYMPGAHLFGTPNQVVVGLIVYF